MKKLLFFSAVLFLVACTSNTILKKPEDLVPRDTMVLLIYDLHLANAAKHVKNKNLEKKVNYMPLVFDKYKIDSLRFQTSNTYYISKIDDYASLLEEVKKRLEKVQEGFAAQKQILDSIRRDSLNRALKLKQDTVKETKKKTLSDKVTVKE